MPETPRKPSDADLAEKEIQAAIVNGDLPPGALRSVDFIIDALELESAPGQRMSPAVVREALIRLADVGLVRFELHKGARIRRTGRR